MANGQDVQSQTRQLLELIKALFRRPGNKPQTKEVNVSSKELDAFCHNLGNSVGMMKERATELARDGQFFKAFLVDARAEQLDEMHDYFLENKHPQKSLDPSEMAEDLKQRVESRLAKIEGSAEHTLAQKDFARLQLSPDEMLSIDQDILQRNFSMGNAADAALFRALNKSTESLARGTVNPPKSRAEQAGLKVSHPSIWDSVPEHVKTSVQEARAERAGRDRAPNISTSGDKPSGFEHESIMPPQPPM